MRMAWLPSILLLAMLFLAMGHAARAEPPAVPGKSSPAPLRQIVGDQPPVDVAGSLPKASPAINVGSPVDDSALSSRQMIVDNLAPPNFAAGMGRTSLYGLSGQGFRFVYCFDRSESMGGGGNNTLRSARTELLASLDSLGPTHQFQIIFYNDHPTVFEITGMAGRLVFGTDQNKQQARQFVERIRADGGTDHMAALEMALNLNPDVIFFLTDADQPRLSPEQLARIGRRNRISIINTIEFGQGPAPAKENFLRQLARQNGGEYTYIDITKRLKPAGH